MWLTFILCESEPFVNYEMSATYIWVYGFGFWWCCIGKLANLFKCEEAEIIYIVLSGLCGLFKKKKKKLNHAN